MKNIKKRGVLGNLSVCVCVNFLTTTNCLFSVNPQLFFTRKLANTRSSGFFCGLRKPANPCHPKVKSLLRGEENQKQVFVTESSQ